MPIQTETGKWANLFEAAKAVLNEYDEDGQHNVTDGMHALRKALIDFGWVEEAEE